MKTERPHRQLGIRVTPLRDDLIGLFINNPGTAFSESELNEYVNGEFDRTSVYRSIKMLLKKVFIHKVICENGVLKYALTLKNNVIRNHPHFQCTKCGKVSCLTQQKVPELMLPDGYQVSAINLLIRGVGPCCKTRSAAENQL